MDSCWLHQNERARRLPDSELHHDHDHARHDPSNVRHDHDISCVAQDSENCPNPLGQPDDLTDQDLSVHAFRIIGARMQRVVNQIKTCGRKTCIDATDKFVKTASLEALSNGVDYMMLGIIYEVVVSMAKANLKFTQPNIVDVWSRDLQLRTRCLNETVEVIQTAVRSGSASWLAVQSDAVGSVSSVHAALVTGLVGWILAIAGVQAFNEVQSLFTELFAIVSGKCNDAVAKFNDQVPNECDGSRGTDHVMDLTEVSRPTSDSQEDIALQTRAIHSEAQELFLRRAGHRVVSTMTAIAKLSFVPMAKGLFGLQTPDQVACEILALAACDFVSKTMKVGIPIAGT